MPNVAVYAGSFDPPTNGHAWMIRESAGLFDELIVAVARNPEKHYSYELNERAEWLRGMSEGLSNVSVDVIENQFLAHYARERGARFVVRGIRNEADYQYERAMRYVNADLNPELSTVCLMPPRELCEVSSSFVKNMIGPVGWERIVASYVPEAVFMGLERHHETQITG